MLETVFNAKPRFWGLVVVLLGMVGVGALAYLVQLDQGLTVTGMSRDVTWAFYIAQFTYMVGVAAAGVMVVLPYYFHHYKKFKNMIILAEFQAIAACIVCMLFIVVDLGQPARVMNVILHPTPNSMLFYDMIVLNGYLFLNLLVGWYTLEASRKGIEPGKWIKPFIYLSVVWAFSIHTVTAFLYQGLPGRHFWLTAILAPRFLASAFCSGPAILMLFTLIIEKFTDFRAGEEAKRTLAKIITYAMCVNVFFLLCEMFTAFYSNIPGHMHTIQFLWGAHHPSWVSVAMWIATVLGLGSLVLLIPYKFRNNMKILPFALVILVIATWIDKGIGLLVGGFTPTPFETITPYAPTITELLISLGVYGAGFLIVAVLFKVAISIKAETGHLRPQEDTA